MSASLDPPDKRTAPRSMNSEPPEQPATPGLPPELRRAVPVTIAAGAVGLTLFLVGFALGVVSGERLSWWASEPPWWRSPPWWRWSGSPG